MIKVRKRILTGGSPPLEEEGQKRLTNKHSTGFENEIQR